jgi:hypothetical protein
MSTKSENFNKSPRNDELKPPAHVSTFGRRLFDYNSDPSFLAVHFQLLQALYANRTSSDQLDEQLCDDIQTFLNDSEKFEVRQLASRWNGIAEQAAKLSMKECPSPAVVPKHSPQLLLSTPRVRNSQQEPTSSSTSFSIVNHLLQQRASKAQHDFELHEEPYQALLEKIQEQMQLLEEEMKQSQQQTDTTNTDEQRSLHFANNYKMQLWKRLEQDLQSLI